VGIALTLPNLKSLSISRIDRTFHPHVETRHNSPPPHDTPTFLANGIPKTAPAILPSLFSIPTLRHLAIHNTWLGDPLFASADLPIQSQLETLEIGAFESASPAENARWCTQILHCAGSHVRNATLGSGIIPTIGPLSLPLLERVCLTPLFSPALLPSTLRVLAEACGSLRHIHVECLTVDLEDVCEELSECVEHVNGGPYNLKLRVFPALQCDTLVDHPASSDCVPVASLDKNAQDALSRLEDAFTSAGTPISIIGSNAPEQADEQQDWDGLTVVDETAVSSMEIKGTTLAEYPWVQVGAW
jgi:hypothetical protein